jgi:hypothetical protein
LPKIFTKFYYTGDDHRQQQLLINTQQQKLTNAQQKTPAVTPGFSNRESRYAICNNKPYWFIVQFLVYYIAM